MNATERFLKYVTYSTASSEKSETRPSTPGQRALTGALAEEMREMGLSDVYITEEDGAVYGTVPATAENAPAIGFLAHVDTSSSASGENVRPRIVRDYDGGEIVLCEGVSMSPDKNFPDLAALAGEDLIVTDGKTLLGADDKAGVAEIMAAAEMLLASDKPHGKVKIGFTTDEEIGKGPDLIDVGRFGCDFAYTVDGGRIGEIEYENFNAASAFAEFTGVGVHPGSAKDVMKNACSMAMEFCALLPAQQKPEYTSGYEGFIHLDEMSGDVTSAKLSFIVRDHDLGKLREKEEIMKAAADFICRKYGEGSASLRIEETYYNMREKIEPHPELIEAAKSAFEKAGAEPVIIPIRGGTDGSKLSFMGLPCPNLSTGGYHFHGIYECIPVSALETMPRVIVNIVDHFAGGDRYEK
ncbi:MAG: peptidase T [Clostridiales bacterium]|nr:peptidase T [Clostridiales bacterium]